VSLKSTLREGFYWSVSTPYAVVIREKSSLVVLRMVDDRGGWRRTPEFWRIFRAPNGL